MAVAESDRFVEAETRVAVDTLVFEKKATLDVDVDGFATLPSDLIYLEGLYSETTPLDPLLLEDYLAFLSGPGMSGYIGDSAYTILGRQLRVIPTGARTLTLFYWARPPETDGVTFTLSGPALSLVRHLKLAYQELDRGEPEVGAMEIAQYELDARRVRRRSREKRAFHDSLRSPLAR